MADNPFTPPGITTRGPLDDMPLDRRWRQQGYPAPIVVALLRHSVPDRTEQILLIRRNGTTYTDQWALVGGKWDFGEQMSDAVVREVKEETGLESSFVALRAVISERVAPLDRDSLAAHFLLFLCDLEVTDGVATEQAEGEVAWFDRAEIEQLHNQHAIIPSDYAMLSAFMTAEDAAPYVEVDMGSSAAAVRMYRFHHHPAR